MAPLHELPLSWEQTATRRTRFHSLDLLGTKWVSLAEIPYGRDVLGTISRQHSDSLLIRGCSADVAENLGRLGFTALYIGQEAVIELQNNLLAKKSLRQLIHRGQRHGKVVEIPFSHSNKKKIELLKSKTPYAGLPFLTHLFRTSFEPHLRCFVFEDHEGRWLGAVTISKMSEIKVQAELLLRHSQAPVGIMEALVYAVSQRLKANGFKEWSLGEVPFLKSARWQGIKVGLLGFIGRSLRFAYNYEGLFNFKNKFKPQWRPVYICGRPRVRYRALIVMLFKTNFAHLLFKRLFRPLTPH